MDDFERGFRMGLVAAAKLVRQRRDNDTPEGALAGLGDSIEAIPVPPHPKGDV
jgi:hypothetical protein